MGLKAVGGAAAQGGSDGRDVVGGGCTPLSARVTATNNHLRSIHGGCIGQVHTVLTCSFFSRYLSRILTDDHASPSTPRDPSITDRSTGFVRPFARGILYGIVPRIECVGPRWLIAFLRVRSANARLVTSKYSCGGTRRGRSLVSPMIRRLIRGQVTQVF